MDTTQATMHRHTRDTTQEATPGTRERVGPAWSADARRLIYVASVFVVLATGCASSSPAPEVTAADLDRILDVANAQTYSEPQRCLSTSRYRDVEIINDRYLVFEGLGGRAWLNELSHDCPGMRPGRVLRFDITTGQLCAMDSVTAIDRSLMLYTRVSATCSLGKFQPISSEQADALKALTHR